MLGLLVLWAVVFSFAGDAAPATIVLWFVGLGAGALALHRLLNYREERGWIYYRTIGGGDGRLSATAEWRNMFDPSRRHLQQAVREGEWKRDEGVSVQDIIEELIRGTGHIALRIITVGRYRSSPESRLAEGAIGFGLIALVAYILFTAGAY